MLWILGDIKAIVDYSLNPNMHSKYELSIADKIDNPVNHLYKTHQDRRFVKVKSQIINIIGVWVFNKPYK